ncbi:hypothetical protein [Streptomyces sp. NPDC052107]|uniref:hypothetical protein n=1 Tax=Streptomyces sp. NPDC052107 TaxID=3155632 RepID=UPI00343A9D44
MNASRLGFPTHAGDFSGPRWCGRRARGNDTASADQKLDSAWQSAETRLISEITALRIERQWIVTEAAKANVAKKPSRWW